MGSKRYETFIQGSLDGLCGLYSVINSISFISDQRIDQRTLFDLFIKRLDETGRLGKVITHGTTRTVQRELLKIAKNFCALHGHRLTWLHVASRDYKTLDNLWRSLTIHQSAHGEGSIVIGLSGKHEHWTCIRKVNERSLLIADCNYIQRIAKNHCTIDLDNKQGLPHVLDDIFFMSFREATAVKEVDLLRLSA